MPQEKVIDVINDEICKVGVCPSKVLFGKAAHVNAPKGGEVGAVVYVDEPELAFHTAFHLKERLRFGTYQLLLDESSSPNVNFKAIVDYHPANTLDMIVEEWQKVATEVFEQERIFVSAFFYMRGSDIYIGGNANTTMVGNVETWKKVLKKVVRRMNHHQEIFVIDPTFRENKQVV